MLDALTVVLDQILLNLAASTTFFIKRYANFAIGCGKGL